MPIIIVMSLNFDDLQNIRAIMREELDERMTPLEGKVEAMENDVKDIYGTITRLERGVLAIARQTGSKLPRSFNHS